MTTGPALDSWGPPYSGLVTRSEKQPSELHSAVTRLPLAVVAADGNRKLWPLNAAAVRLFDDEALDSDLLDGYRSHPLAELIRSIDRGGEIPLRQMLTFPSGSRYCIRMSSRSERNAGGWLLFVIEETKGASCCDALFDRWGLSRREREIVAYLVRGASTPAMCHSAGISLNTLRTHIRSILDKSDTHSRAILVAKVLGVSAPV